MGAARRTKVACDAEGPSLGPARATRRLGRIAALMNFASQSRWENENTRMAGRLITKEAAMDQLYAAIQETTSRGTHPH